MKVNVENTSNLGRKISITVAADEIQKQVDKKLQELTKTVKMDGFRPGKVPLSVVQKRFGKAVHDEVIGNVLQSSLFEAIQTEKLQPAGMPNIESIKSEEGQPLEYVAAFDIYPEIKLANLSKLNLEKITVEIKPKDIDDMIHSIRKQHLEWEEVDRASNKEDQVTVDFEGSKDDKPFEGGSAKDVPLVLGSNTFIPGFEDQLIGVKAGDEKTVEVTFPKDYHVADLAGQPVKFAVKVHKVSAPKLPPLDEEFLKKLGMEEEGGLDKFREQIKEHMERELDNAIKNKQKVKIFDELLKAHEVEVPQALIDQEIHNMLKSEKQEISADDIKAAPDFVRDEAKKRVTMGLIVGEIIKQHEIKADQGKVREHVEHMAKSYQHPEQLIAYYYSKKENLASVEAVVLEDQVVDKLMEEATVKETSMSYQDVMKPTT